MLRMVIVASAAVLIVLAAALSLLTGGNEARGQTTHNINVGDTYFCDPSFAGGVCETNVSVGDTVNWQWVGSLPHTVTQCDASFSTCPPAGGFDSGSKTSGTFTQAFNSAGTFPYQCNVHFSGMRGRIIVSAAQATPTATATGGTTSPTTTRTGSPAASPAATQTAAPAAVPSTGGTDGGDGTSVWVFAVLAAGALLTGSAVVGMAKLRSR